MVIRRAADPINVKRIWDAIKSSNQPPDSNKIAKYLQKHGGSTVAEVEQYIKQALKDGLILTHARGKNSGEQTYKIPTQSFPELGEQDWYCFECHLAGDVTICSNCFRVLHPNCSSSAKRFFESYRKSRTYSQYNKIKPIVDKDANHTINISSDEENPSPSGEDGVHSSTNQNRRDKITNIESYIYDMKLCSVCNISNIDTDCGLEKAELNYLLKFVLHRIRSWLPNTITHTMAEEDRPAWLTDSELTWRANHLFFEHKDMSVIEVNLNTETYSHVFQFLADILTVKHNVAIFHGIESQEYGAAELMVRDTLYDLNELSNCVDCYKHSNEKIHLKWFCLPCRRPHKLVWAKQKGYPYWPAKVIKETSTHFDVRFFGGKYERAVLLKSFVKPISMPKEKLQIKQSAAFKKAYEELLFHQKLMHDPKELELLRSNSKQKRNVLIKQKSGIMSPPKTPTKTVKGRLGRPRPRAHQSLPLMTDELESKPSPSKATKRKNSLGVLNERNKKQAVPLENNSQLESASISGNVIDISDGEDEPTEYSFRQNNFSLENFTFDENFEPVSSSTENYRAQESAAVVPETGMQQLDHPYSDSVEKMRRKMEQLTNKKEMIKCAMESMQIEIDRITNDHNEHLKRLFESHNAQISETKKKQWCFNCEQDAIYHCCWNTAYCSPTCQQQHWQAEHKKVCRRKR